MLNPQPMIKIKICGIQTPELAAQTAKAGADFIGLIFHPDSRRCVNMMQAKKISAVIKENGAIPVAVFVHHSAEEMQDICQKTDIQVIQLHGKTARDEHDKLPDDYQRFYVQSVLSDGSLDLDINNDPSGLTYCDPMRDYLLFDHITSGKGQCFDWHHFHYHNQNHFRLGLAGGLNSQNIIAAIQKFHPALVDTSSGVENVLGQKEIKLIQDFIHKIRQEN